MAFLPPPAQQLLTHTPTPYTFTFTPFLQKTYQHSLPPPSSNPPSGDQQQSQPNNNNTGGFGSLVCKHWLRGLCKKGLTCEFLHEYNLRKMPECNFFVRNGYCSNGDECLYLHIDPSSKLPPCPHYDRGFCPLGPKCDKRHLKRNICLYYLAGFCPDGKQCRQGAHPRWTKDELMEKPTMKVEKTAEELEREEQERERHRERERERDMERRAERDRERGGDGDRHDRGHDKGGRFGRGGEGEVGWEEGGV
ncbi:Putative mRNA 3'-end-processing protein [Podospora comata]|uniref:mRNA 3'-end-processing protein n=1 Tax=Podospora comata TaxID=48703 RepID=A0ABY6RUJ1_PODCO|nr:Putative mRNA 3'-end-processing protein [Podospora comata]